MNVALIGASGQAGSRILKELADRGHGVTAIARHPREDRETAGRDGGEGRCVRRGRPRGAAEGPRCGDQRGPFHSQRSEGPRRGGAGVRPEALSGRRRRGQPGGRAGRPVDRHARFSAAYKPEAAGGLAFLDLLRTVDDLDWTFLCPSAEFVPGERTGAFRLGGDQLLLTDHGSSISFEDYAIALVDELERPRHLRRRFTVGY